MANTNSNSKIALYLPMIGGNSSTTTKDYSVNDHTVTFNGNAVISKDQFYDQNIQSSSKLDGSGAYVRIMHSNSIEPENCDFTLILKVYPTATTRDALYASQSDYWFGLDTNYNVTRNVNLWASSNGSSWDMISGDGAGNGIGHISMNLNEWNNIITTWDGTTFKLYLNGNELTITNSPFISNDTLTYIGASSSTIVNKLWKGGISDIKIWNRALTTAEILLVSQNRPVLDGLTNRWKLDKDYTDSVGDNDGTNNGSYLSSVDDQVASDVSSARVTANDIIKVFPINNKIMNVNIEEA